MSLKVDLKQLAVERPAAGNPPRRRRPWPTRWGIPLAIAAGFLGIVGWSAREQWLPAKRVTVVPVVLAKAEVQQAGTPLFQAAGWIEPRPTATACTALAEGVVDELLVVEGDEVKKGQIVARLIDKDASIALRQAESTLKLRQAEQAAAQAALEAAQTNFDHPTHLQAAQADADAALAELETEMSNLPFLVKVAEARLKLARLNLEGKRAASEAIAGRTLQAAQSEHDAATAALAELEQRGPSLARQQEAWKRKCAALRAKLELKTEERRAVDEAKANLSAAEARVSQAELAIEAAELRLERMKVRSPMDGRVLALVAQPGRRLAGMNAASDLDASTVVTLYDPRQLQLRVDVRLEDVPQVQLDQPVRITTAASREPLEGRVLAITSQADIQKNTLSVKVSIDNPTPLVRPEMIAQVVFLAPPNAESSDDSQEETVRLLVAKELVESGEGGASVWVADADQGVARRRAIQLGRASTEELVEVTQGLTALDKLIVAGREGLAEGDRIRVAGNDPTMGARNP